MNDGFNVSTCNSMARIQLLAGVRGWVFLHLQVCQNLAGHAASYVMIRFERGNWD